ncbi:DUF2079 domain-containing protein [Actinomadura harenae]|uniref:DUF2079 domain-containing protein n=1 Tax=Actinomadura harenae TaxID=2483351 RepID=A0A3M2M7C8_9ACTN|nr:DUF2079 domain-containing protein [Actinomadura harenae]RMI45432.1 DUF2079 domain-containing protein [Actinomadura harenae]
MPLALAARPLALIAPRVSPQADRSPDGEVRRAGGGRRAIPWVLAAVFFLAYGALSVTRHLAMESTGYDLGIFEQAVRAYSRFEPPVATLKSPGFDVLGDHFHPVVALVAPLYRVFPSPVTLLLVQAALFAVSVVPVTRLATDWGGRRSGTCVGLAYGLSWGIQQAVQFDFHEIAFAVPLLACCVESAARRRWASAARWALPLLLVKEDQALMVAAIGAYILCRGDRRTGAALMAVAAVTGLVVMGVVIPAFSPSHAYRYAHTLHGGRPFAGLAVKAGTVEALLAPTVFLALRSPLVLLAVPYVAARFWATEPHYWGTGFHYSAVLTPILSIAAADALHRSHHFLGRAAAPAILAVAVAITMVGPWPVGPQPLARLLSPATWTASDRYRAAAATLALVPDGAEVAAANRLAPQLTSRCRVFRLLASPPWRRPEWAVAVTGAAPFRPLAAADASALEGLPAAGYRLVASGGGVAVYRLALPPGRPAAPSS